MAGFLADVKQNLKQDLREKIEENTGIVGQAMRVRRERAERKKDNEKKAKSIKEISGRFRSDNKSLKRIELGFVDISNNLREILKWADVVPDIHQDIIEQQLPEKQKIQPEEAPTKQPKVKVEDFSKEFQGFDSLLDWMKKARTSASRVPWKRLGRLGGRAAGVLGLGYGLYESYNFIQQTGYGERMAAGEGKLAEKAFRENVTDFSQYPLTQTQAQDVLDSKSERDIQSFGGRARLEQIAKVQPTQVDYTIKPTTVPPPPAALAPAPAPQQVAAAPATGAQPAAAAVQPPARPAAAPPPPPPPAQVSAPPPAAAPKPELDVSPKQPPVPKPPAATSVPAVAAAGGGSPGSLSSVTKLSDSGVILAGLKPEFEKRAAKMAAAFKEQTGATLKINSGFRSTEKQQQLYDEWVAGGKQGKVVARPGTSPHEKGIAVDIQPSSGPKGTGNPKGFLNELAGPVDQPTGWLEQFGLARPVTSAKVGADKKEDWHVQLSGSVMGADMQAAASRNGIVDPSTGKPQQVPVDPKTGKQLIDTSKSVEQLKREQSQPGQTTIVVKNTMNETVYDKKKKPQAQSAAAVG